jgi:dTDP-4-amino-4,6-dideoxygalactose transaminase
VIPLFKVFMPESVVESLKDVLLSGYIGQGPKVEEFERELSEYFGWPSLVTTNSGTSALHLALKLLNIGPGDTVLTTPLTCTATNWPVLLSGAEPRWCDIDPDTLNIDPEDVARKITGRTKAIIAVHWGGYPCDLDRLREVAGGIPIIEDCAHAFGSLYRDQLIGSSGNYCMFSFQAIKTLNTIDGGCLCVPPDQLERAKLLRWYGIDREAEPEERHELRCGLDISEAGTKWHMNDVSATVGLEQFKYVEKNLSTQACNGVDYDFNLMDIPGVTLIQQKTDRLSSYWLYTIRVENRKGFCRKMFDAGIAVSPVHARNDTHSCVSKFRVHLPNLDMVENEYVSIPCGWWVTDEDHQYIVDTIKEGW